MQTKPFARITQETLLLALTALLALTVLIQMNPAKKTPARDSGFYTYIGDQIVRGKLPYRDAWESKPPAIFYMDALGLWLGHDSRWGIWGLEFLFLAVAVYVSLKVMRELWGTWPALFGTLFWVYGLTITIYGGNLTEEYPLPLHFLSILLFLKLLEAPRRRLLSFLLGGAFALAFLFRPNNAVTEAALILALLIATVVKQNRRALFSSALWMGIGALLPIGITVLYFWSHGLLQELLNASLLYNLTYSGTPLTGSSPLTVGFRIFGWMKWILIAGYLLAVLHTIVIPRNRFFYLFLLIGWPMVIYLSDPARRNYDHYYMNWLPFLALLSGLTFYYLWSRLFSWIKNGPPLQLAGLTLTFILTLTFFFRYGSAGDLQKAVARLANRGQMGVEAISPTAAYVNENTKLGDLVLFWGAYPGENYMSKRDSPSAVLFYPLFVKSNIATELDNQFLNELVQNRPVLIVDMGDDEALSLDPVERQKLLEAGQGWPYLPNNINQVFAFIDQNYTWETNVRGKGVYRLKGRQ